MNLHLTDEQLGVAERVGPPVALILLLLCVFFLHREFFNPSLQKLSASVAASDVASRTNEERIGNGLPPLAVNPLLNEAAQLKADDMASHSYYAHTGPDGKTMLDWMSESGYHYLNAGENLVIDRTSAQQAVDAWMNSPDHRANILRPQFTEIGVGVAEGEYQGVHTIFVVQEFGTPYPSATRLAVALKPAPAVSVSQPKAQPKPATPTVPTPVAIPHLASLAPKKPLTTSSVKIASTSPNLAPNAASTTIATSSMTGQGSGTIFYTLAPEFFTPVTLSARQEAQNTVQSAPPQAASVSRLSVLVTEIRLYLRHIF